MDLAEARAMLARTPPTLTALLGGLPEDWLHGNDGEGTWSAYDIAGHLLHAEQTNWVPRYRLIIERGTGRPFQPFDREAMLGWQREPVAELLLRFGVARQASLAELAGLVQADTDRRGLHPQVGEVSLGQMLAAWVAHDLTHVGQIGEVLARRYRDAVGPWRSFMPALDRVAEAE
jgi:uncharacterized damage-inducible protein DinB